MPRLSQNPELRRAAQLAKVGPETWNSWKEAASVPLILLKSFMTDSIAGDLLRSAGVDMPKKSGDLETIKDNIIDFGIPNLPIGQVKRLKHAIRKNEPGADRLREVMAKEMGLRGKAQQDDYIDQVLRSTPFHGRGYEHYPNTGEIYNPGIAKAGNFGEPQGLSVTYRDPAKFVREHTSFAKRPQKYYNAEDRLLDKRYELNVPTIRDNLRAKLDKLDIEINYLEDELIASGIPENELMLNGKYNGLIEERSELVNKIIHAPGPDKKVSGLNKSIDLLREKYKTPPMARVFPRFHGRPIDKVVKGWKGGGDEKILQDAYTYALHQMPEFWSGSGYTQDMLKESLPNYFTAIDIDLAGKIANSVANDPDLLRIGELAVEHFKKREVPPHSVLEVVRKKFSPTISGSLLAVGDNKVDDFHMRQISKLNDVLKLVKTTKDLTQKKLPDYKSLRYNTTDRAKKDFNTHLTDYLRSYGYRGVLYSPMRYNEWELRMLDPRDVIQQDIRQVNDPALRRMYKGPTDIKEEVDNITNKMIETYEKAKSASTVLEHDELMKEFSKLGTKKDILEYISSQTPSPNISLPKKSQALKSWKEISDYQANPFQESGHSPYALGAIYKDLDLPNLKYLDDAMRRAQAQEVKTRLLAEEARTLEDGLQLGRIGDRRVRRDYIPDFDMDYDKMTKNIAEHLGLDPAKIKVPFDKIPQEDIHTLLYASEKGDLDSTDYLLSLVSTDKPKPNLFYQDLKSFIKVLDKELLNSGLNTKVPKGWNSVDDLAKYDPGSASLTDNLEVLGDNLADLSIPINSTPSIKIKSKPKKKISLDMPDL